MEILVRSSEDLEDLLDDKNIETTEIEEDIDDEIVEISKHYQQEQEVVIAISKTDESGATSMCIDDFDAKSTDDALRPVSSESYFSCICFVYYRIHQFFSRSFNNSSILPVLNSSIPVVIFFRLIVVQCMLLWIYRCRSNRAVKVRSKQTIGTGAKLIRQLSEDIPEITITQHLHDEDSDDETYLTSYSIKTEDQPITEQKQTDEEKELFVEQEEILSACQSQQIMSQIHGAVDCLVSEKLYEVTVC
jgi:hypothetical protein